MQAVTPRRIVECPTGSGRYLTLDEIAAELSVRLIRFFLRDADGRRPVLGDQETFQRDPQWRDYPPFHEYFHGDTGRGVGASHQTGWTALVAKLIDRSGDLVDADEPERRKDRAKDRALVGTAE